MGVLNRTARNPLGYRPDTLALSEMMQTFMINYVNTGNPNEGTGECPEFTIRDRADH